MLSVIILNVVILIVMAPFRKAKPLMQSQKKGKKCLDKKRQEI